jgi:tetratricopeptide (TPR) repeat protein
MELDTQLARAQGLQGRFAHALATLEAVEAGLKEGERRAEVRFQLEMGRVLRSSGNAEAAKSFFEKAVELAAAAGESALEMDARHMVALAEPEPARRLQLNHDAVERAEASQDPAVRGWRGSLWNNIGMDFHALGRLADARLAFENSLAAWSQDRPERVPIARWMIGWTLRLEGRLAEAQEIQESLARHHRKAGTDAGYVYEELGEIHLTQIDGPFRADHLAQARLNFAAAYAALSANRDLADEPERLARMKRLGEGKLA